MLRNKNQTYRLYEYMNPTTQKNTKTQKIAEKDKNEKKKS